MNTRELEMVITNAIKEYASNDGSKNIPVGVSNRHIHLSREDLRTLFGDDYGLNNIKNLSQPGQFAAKETVTIAGPKGSMTGVRVLGPLRDKTQVEISLSDSFTLGVKAPIRDSGDLKGSGSIIVIGPKGSVKLKENLIIAKRHIHMSDDDARRLDVKDGQIVNVITSGERACVLGDVVVRVNPKYALELHVDMDEANASRLSNGDMVRISSLTL